MHQQSPSHRFPALLWDSLPHGGASQVHPHIHATVHSEQYYGTKNIHLSLSLCLIHCFSSGHFESIRFASERYYREYEHVEKHLQKNYFRAIQDVHVALNLTIFLNGLTILLPIVSDQ